MIAWFPAPYPDETFDSLCYRYAERMKYPNKNAIGEDLFGKRIDGVAVDVPARLAYFMAQLPPGNEIKAAAMLENHSFLPYYRPFLNSATYAQMLIQILGEQSGANVLGALSKFRKHVPVYLRYCPQCVGLDRQQQGETYWHRPHQLPGVRVCVEHAVWLEDSLIYAKYRNFSKGPTTAEAALQDICLQPRPLDTSKTAQRLLQLSQNSIWMLTQNLNLDSEALFRQYRLALWQKGYLTQTGQLYKERFLQNFLDYYSEELLNDLGCEVSSQGKRLSAWTKHLAESYQHVRFSPLQHLLLIQFLSEETCTFFSLADGKHLPFGAGPWPCLNKTCPHYRKLVITRCRIFFDKDRPRAEFQCDCGFTYRRWESDQTKDIYSYGWVSAYGPVWDDKLRELWNEPGITIKVIQETLGIGGSDTIKCHALRLGLPFQQHRDLVRGKSVCVPRNPGALRPGRIAAHRQKVLEMLGENPTLTRTQLAEKSPASFSSLMDYDREWLNRTVPHLKQACPVVINWAERDKTLAGKIPMAAETIKAGAGKPVRVTRRGIGRIMEVIPWLTNQLLKLPETQKVLEEVLESREAFAIRRLRWAQDYFIQNNEVPRRWALIQKAGVEQSMSPEVENLVETLVAEITATIGERQGRR
jgi:hypothetical protein